MGQPDRAEARYTGVNVAVGRYHQAHYQVDVVYLAPPATFVTFRWETPDGVQHVVRSAIRGPLGIPAEGSENVLPRRSLPEDKMAAGGWRVYQEDGFFSAGDGPHLCQLWIEYEGVPGEAVRVDLESCVSVGRVRQTEHPPVASGLSVEGML